MLSQSQMLQILNLSGNMIKNEGARILCNGLLKSSHKTLQSLDISDNEITHKSCKLIHDLLIASNILRLNLRANNIGNKGGEILS